MHTRRVAARRACVVIVRAYSGKGVAFTQDATLTLIEVLIARKVAQAVQTVGSATYRHFLQPLVWIGVLITKMLVKPPMPSGERLR